MSSTVLGLEQERRKSGVSLQQIAETTKISTRFLRAIETEEFDKLPGGVFNVNYIRQYAGAIGYSEHKLLEQYQIAESARQAEQESVYSPVPAKGLSFRLASWFRGPSPVIRH